MRLKNTLATLISIGVLLLLMLSGIATATEYATFTLNQVDLDTFNEDDPYANGILDEPLRMYDMYGNLSYAGYGNNITIKKGFYTTITCSGSNEYYPIRMAFPIEQNSTTPAYCMKVSKNVSISTERSEVNSGWNENEYALGISAEGGYFGYPMICSSEDIDVDDYSIEYEIDGMRCFLLKLDYFKGSLSRNVRVRSRLIGFKKIVIRDMARTFGGYEESLQEVKVGNTVILPKKDIGHEDIVVYLVAVSMNFYLLLLTMIILFLIFLWKRESKEKKIEKAMENGIGYI